MKLRLDRDTFTSVSTIGSLSIDGQAFCWTLELPKKDGLPGSCIPCGTYKVVAYPSPHWKRLMPLLVGIPRRSEIEIHPGNTAKTTKGCIEVGGSRPGKDFIGNSDIIFEDLWERIKGPLAAGDCTIEVTEPQETHLDAGDL